MLIQHITLLLLSDMWQCGLLFYFINALGRYVASPGNRNSKTAHATMAIKNGYTPPYITLKGTFVIFFTMKTLMATGGRTTPIITVIAIMMVNQIGSYPSFVAAGKKIGVASIMNARSSINEPPTW